MPSNRNYAVAPQASSVAGQPANILQINTKATNAAPLPCLFPCTAAAEAVLTNPAVPSSALILAVPSKSIMMGMPFEVLASGCLSQQIAAGTMALNLYQGNSLTPANNTLVKAIAAATFTGIVPFYVSAKLIGDPASGKIVGTVKSLINLTLGAEAAIAAALNATWNADPVTQFVLSVVPSGANAGNYVQLYEFAVNF